jgi:uncharacterized protein (DUF1810 family)
MQDLYNLQRFVDAQESVWDHVRAELRAGSKASHWMWFIFPQLKALGRSRTAQYFGITSLPEAVAYWQNPLLGSRLGECSELVLAVDGRSAHEILGSPDDLKLCSSMTLFEQAAPTQPAFNRVLDRYFEGRRDDRTLALLNLS